MVKSDNNALWNVAVTKKKPKNAVPEEKTNRVMSEARPEKAVSEEKPKTAVPEAEPQREPDEEEEEMGGCKGCLTRFAVYFSLFLMVGMLVFIIGTCMFVGGDSGGKADPQEERTVRSASVSAEKAVPEEENKAESANAPRAELPTERGATAPEIHRAYQPLDNFSKEGIIAAYERDGRPDLADLARRYPDGFLRKEALELVIFDSPEDMNREYEKWNEAKKEQELDEVKREELLWYEKWNKSRKKW